MASTKQIDLGFRIAGYSKGRPTADNTPESIYPNDNTQVIGMFDDDLVEQLLLEAGENPKARAESVNPGFPYLFASLVLEQIMNSGFTSEGRLTDITSATAGGLTTTFQSSETYKESIRNRVSELKAKARALQSPIESFSVSQTRTGGGSGISFSDLAGSIVAGEHIEIDRNFNDQTLTLNAPYDIRADDGFGDAVYDSLKLILKTGNNVIVTFSDSSEEIRFNTELDRETLHTPLKTTLLAGSNISIVSDEVNDTLTISSTGGGGGGGQGGQTTTTITTQEEESQITPLLSLEGGEWKTIVNSTDLGADTIFKISMRFPGVNADPDSLIVKQSEIGADGRFSIFSGIFSQPFTLRYTTTDGLQLRPARGIGVGAVVIVAWDKTVDQTINIPAPEAGLSYTDLKDTLVAGANVTITADDTAETLTLASSGGGSSSGRTSPPTQAEVYDQTKRIIKAGTGIVVTNADTPTTQTIGLNSIQLQTNVIKSANEDGNLGTDLRGKFLAVDSEDQTKLALVNAPSGGAGPAGPVDNDAIESLEKLTHEITYDGDFTWENITAESTKARIDGSQSPEGAIDASNLTRNSYSSVDTAIVIGRDSTPFNIAVRLPLDARATDFRIYETLSSGSPTPLITQLPSTPAATTENYKYYLVIDYVPRQNSDITLQEKITPPTEYSGTLKNPQFDNFEAEWVFSDGNTQAIEYFRSDTLTNIFGTLDSSNTKRKDIRIAVRGYVNDIDPPNGGKIAIAGQTIRAASDTLQPGEYINEKGFNLYGTFSNSLLQTIDNNSKSQGSVNIDVTVAKASNGDPNTVRRTLPWLTTAQQTAAPLSAYIPAAAIIGGVGGGNEGGGSLTITTETRSNVRLARSGSFSAISGVSIPSEEFDKMYFVITLWHTNTFGTSDNTRTIFLKGSDIPANTAALSTKPHIYFAGGGSGQGYSVALEKFAAFPNTFLRMVSQTNGAISFNKVLCYQIKL